MTVVRNLHMALQAPEEMVDVSIALAVITFVLGFAFLSLAGAAVFFSSVIKLAPPPMPPLSQATVSHPAAQIMGAVFLLALGALVAAALNPNFRQYCCAIGDTTLDIWNMLTMLWEFSKYYDR